MLSFKKVYFAHSIHDYDSNYEAVMHTFLESIYHGSDHCSIIDPSELEIDSEYEKKIDNKSTRMGKYLTEMKFYFNKIKRCNDLVAIYSSKTNEFTDGVKKEITYAQENGIDTYRLVFSTEEYEGLVEINKDFSDGKILIKGLC